MTAATRERCRYRECSSSVRWVTTENGVRALIDENTVPAGAKGAFVLIGQVAFREVGAVRRLAHMFDLDEPSAYVKAHEEYTWHLLHKVTCPYEQAGKRRG